MKIKLTHLIILSLSVTLFSCGKKSLEIYVSPEGNDQYKGTKARPVATLEKAQYLIRAIKKQHLPEDTITVFLREGVYRLKQGIVLGAGDAGSEKSPVVYRSYPGENAAISGAVPIEKYRLLSKDHFLYGKDPEAGSKIIEIDLREAGLSVFEPMRLSGFAGSEAPKEYILRELHFNGKPMPLSRWPNQGYLTFTGIVTDSSGEEAKSGIVYEYPHISTWKDEPNILLHGYWKYLWADAYEQVSHIDVASRIIWLTPPYNHYNFLKDRLFAAYNVIAEIDRPGEWAYDYRERKIYFYPPDDPAGDLVELSVCEDPLVELNNAAWITFRDIRFEMGAGEGLQISNSSHINIDHCEIHACAREGVVMKAGDHNTISSCEIYDTGRGGIQVDGGNRETLERSDFLIDNCHIHHLSRIDRTYTPGIWVDGVGTKITHCKIHDVPSSAMRINGNDHNIEYNEMYHVVTESDDQGAIDMWGDPTYRGNVFRYNYIHDVGPQAVDEINAHCGRAGIRFDDAISGNLIEANVFLNCSGGLFGAIQIHGGKENLIRNNLFYQCSAGISFTPWKFEKWINITKRSLDFLKRNRELYIARYPELIRLNEDLNKNTVVQNIFLECDKTTLRQYEMILLDANAELHEYPGPIKPEDHHYSLESIPEELKKIEFKPIPFEKIGLKNE